MDILVLGGTGAMGTPLVIELEKGGHCVYVTTRKKRVNKANITYIQGNPHDEEFVKSLCRRHFDAIIDFMIYDLEYFQRISGYFLEATTQYVFISSARVYADSDNKITEENARLVDTIDDHDYLKTNEYALKKAREENILIESGFQNWTIVRPYITYNSNRLQLGTLEKEYWLRRALIGKTVVITEQTAKSMTALTYGNDVAKGIVSIIGNMNTLGQIYHIVNEQTQTWMKILELYNAVYLEKKGRNFSYKIVSDADTLGQVIGNSYQMRYDRFYNREFDSSKIKQLSNDSLVFISVEIGLKKCFEEFLDNPMFDAFSDWAYEGYADRVCKEYSRISSISGLKNKAKYFAWRWIPTPIMIDVRRLIHKKR